MRLSPQVGRQRGAVGFEVCFWVSGLFCQSRTPQPYLVEHAKKKHKPIIVQYSTYGPVQVPDLEVLLRPSKRLPASVGAKPHSLHLKTWWLFNATQMSRVFSISLSVSNVVQFADVNRAVLVPQASTRIHQDVNRARSFSIFSATFLPRSALVGQSGGAPANFSWCYCCFQSRAAVIVLHELALK